MMNFGNKEYILSDDILIVSETDEKGIITYANKSFIEIAQYSLEELIGQPHNIIRHPFMPKIAFAGLWDTISQGITWDGIVLNKTKTGGYYWVKANVFKSQYPNGKIKYISVRVKPSQKEIDAVIKLYPTL